jgi:hypothetical protein
MSVLTNVPIVALPSAAITTPSLQTSPTVVVPFRYFAESEVSINAPLKDFNRILHARSPTKSRLHSKPVKDLKNKTDNKYEQQ